MKKPLDKMRNLCYNFYMRKAVLILVCSLGSGWLFALPESDSQSYATAGNYNGIVDFSEIYAVSQEKPQSLSGTPFKANESETFGIKDASSKGLLAASSTHI